MTTKSATITRTIIRNGKKITITLYWSRSMQKYVTVPEDK